MVSQNSTMRQSVLYSALFLVVLYFSGGARSQSLQEDSMIHVRGGSFVMGDLFREGHQKETPTHQVTLDGFLLGAQEVTVKQFRAFVYETGYRTSAESDPNPERQKILQQQLDEKTEFDDEAVTLYREILSYGGAHCLIPGEKAVWSFISDATWANPHLQQTEDHPVTCVSWNDAASYCNWMSRKAGLPEAYDVASGELLDGEGNATSDVMTVRGYRLPTEAEWEYAARERGKEVRFGNGESVARPSEINFDARDGDSSYVQVGEWRQNTVPVGSFKGNSLGLYDMSGNVWEWCSDYLRTYSDQNQINPYESTGVRRAARGGRWGGGAYELRVTMRYGWASDDRCNNIGFRVARTP